MAKKAIAYTIITITLTIIGGGLFWFITTKNKQTEKIITANNNQQVAIGTTDNLEQNNEAILKKVGVDENGWNIYQSEKYGFEIKVPEKQKFKSNYTYNSGLSYNLYFDNFYIYTYKNYSKMNKVQDKNDLFKIKCESPYIDDFDQCVNDREKELKEFELISINNKNIPHTIELSGLEGETDSIYYFIYQDQIFTFNGSKNYVYPIIETFKLLNKN